MWDWTLNYSVLQLRRDFHWTTRSAVSDKPAQIARQFVHGEEPGARHPHFPK